LSERLSAFESQASTGPSNNEQKQSNLSADSLVTLLTQGLQSSDTTLLDVSYIHVELGRNFQLLENQDSTFDVFNVQSESCSILRCLVVCVCR
jgi:hypothetical protein